MGDDFGGLVSHEPIEMDETENELKKLVFGDGLGFHEGLKSYKSAFTDPGNLVDGDRQQAQVVLDEGDLEGLDDADVRKVVRSVICAFA